MSNYNIQDYATRHGGRFVLGEIENLPSNFILLKSKEIIDECINNLIRNANSKIISNIEWCMTTESMFNVHCIKVETQAFIAISIDVPLRLWTSLANIVTNGARFIRPQNSSPLQWKKRSIIELLHDDEIYSHKIEYNDRYLIDNAFSASLEIIINHELAHIFRGHLDYTRNEHGIAETSESKSTALTLPSTISQILEWDADAYAIHRSLARFLALPLGKPGTNDQKHFGLPPYGRFGSYDQCFFTLGIAIRILTIFFDNARIKARTTSNYPPLWFRNQHFYKQIFHFINQRAVPILKSNTFSELIFDNFLRGSHKAESIWRSLTGYHAEMSDFLSDEKLEQGYIIEKEYNDQLQSIEKALRLFRPSTNFWDM